MKCKKCNSKLVRCYDHDSLYMPTKEELLEQVQSGKEKTLEDAYESMGIDCSIYLHLICDNCGCEFYNEREI